MIDITDHTYAPRAQIENRFLLERFQHAAEVTGPCKVKGLFCHVPDGCLENIVLYGMDGEGGNGNAGSRGGDGDGTTLDNDSNAHRYGWDGDPIEIMRQPKRDGGSNEIAASDCEENGTPIKTTDGGGNTGKPLDFPRAFSRYSTMEEERAYANRASEKHARRNPSSPEATQSNGAPSWTPQKGKLVDGELENRQGVAVSELRFLALCRVMISSMYVSPRTSAHHTGEGSVQPPGMADIISSLASSSQPTADCTTAPPPLLPLPSPPPGQAQFDSVYYPIKEEYFLLNEAFVLPEFLVVHRFVSRPRTMSSRPSPKSDPRSPLPSSTIPPTADATGSKYNSADETRIATCRGNERGSNSSNDPFGGSTTALSPFPRSAFSVVAEMEAAMNGRAQPCLATNLVGASLSFPGGRPSSFSTNTKTDFSTLIDSDKDDAIAATLGRRRERGSGRGGRDSIVCGIERVCKCSHITVACFFCRSASLWAYVP